MFKQTLLAGAALAVSQVASAAFVIDNFNLPSSGAHTACDVVGAAAGNCGSTQQAVQYHDPSATGGIFGNYRELFIQAPATGSSSATYDAIVESGTLVVNTPRNTSNPAQPWTAVVRWDGSQAGTFASSGFEAGLNLPGVGLYGVDTLGINRNGIGATDFTDGNIGFTAQVLGSDGSFTFELQVFSGEENWTSLILGATRVATPQECGADPLCFPAPYTLNIGFNQFNTLSGFQVLGGYTAGTGVNFASVTAAQLIFRGTGSVDFELDMLQAVPEPTSLALVGLGLLGAGLARRRMIKA